MRFFLGMTRPVRKDAFDTGTRVIALRARGNCDDPCQASDKEASDGRNQAHRSHISHTPLQRSGQRVFQIEMIDEDKRRFGEGSWIQLEGATRDENILRKDLQRAHAKLSGRLKTTQQERLDAIERGRGNSFSGAVGISNAQARKSGAAVRDRALMRFSGQHTESQ